MGLTLDLANFGENKKAQQPTTWGAFQRNTWRQGMNMKHWCYQPRIQMYVTAWPQTTAKLPVKGKKLTLKPETSQRAADKIWKWHHVNVRIRCTAQSEQSQNEMSTFISSETVQRASEYQNDNCGMFFADKRYQYREENKIKAPRIFYKLKTGANRSYTKTNWQPVAHILATPSIRSLLFFWSYLGFIFTGILIKTSSASDAVRKVWLQITLCIPERWKHLRQN